MEKNKGKIIEKMKDYKGITLLALAVTIVVLLILTSIGIKLALGNNGIIGEAKSAKEQAEIDDEKGIVKRATTVSLIKNNGSKVEQDTLEKALNDETGEGKTEVTVIRKKFVVEFKDSSRTYSVTANGDVEEYQYKDLAILDPETFRLQINDYIDKILNIKIVDYLKVPEEADASFDVSQAQNRNYYGVGGKK